ncbi:MAG: acetyl-CoA acyltransferase [Nitrospirae bacterium GWC2_57_13]|jgi:acetyl-CoA acyltransferase|nr:MAG: acetyl-CoA acyltransferase [Nitrospirae bacterium GWC2_57_13]OGW42868.1 MAG: acetyl-CoA acyltransferase [Nitrospirae bacterium GWD2_57_8]HAS53536.1 acetyl-CoA C-acyltransferase [Nitrospiraceae bacterium]
MKEIVLIDGFRIPNAKAGTVFKNVTAVELGAAILKEVITRTGIDPNMLDEVIIGNTGMPAEAANIARVIALRAGIPWRVPAYSVQRNCASGMQSVASAVAQIRAGMSEVVLVAGVESMSGFGFYTSAGMKEVVTELQRSRSIGRRIAAVLSLRPKDFIPVPGLLLGLSDPVSGLNMGQTAEVLSRDFAITRREQDEFALMSHQRWTAAFEAGKFRNEVVPFYVPPKFTPVEEDTGPRKNQTMEQLAKLKPFFDRKFGTVTAGNSSPITDGAAAALVMSADKAKELGMKPLGYIKEVDFAGFDPSRMGISPVLATHKILKRTGMKLKDMELIELNEAFAAQVIACERGAVSREFFSRHLPGEEPIGEFRRDIMNVNGGAIALGHPVGSSGLRIIITLLKEMERRGLGTGLATICIGGGQGGATIVERR